MKTTYSIEIAFKISATGHMVLATMYASSAIETLKRLFDLNIADHEIISGVINQRLVRYLCKHCHIKDDSGYYHAKPNGCSHCHHGYCGRIIIAEILEMNEEIWNLCIQKRFKDAEKLWINKYGGITMKQDAFQKMKNGIISRDSYIDTFGL